jgi:hypothetical protein
VLFLPRTLKPSFLNGLGRATHSAGSCLKQLQFQQRNTDGKTGVKRRITRQLEPLIISVLANETENFESDSVKHPDTLRRKSDWMTTPQRQTVERSEKKNSGRSTCRSIQKQK